MSIYDDALFPCSVLNVVGIEHGRCVITIAVINHRTSGLVTMINDLSL
jgi:hypothetical protein